MKKFQIRNVIYLITAESVQKLAWRISDNFDHTEGDFNVSSFYV